MESFMILSYKKMYKLLIDRNMKEKELAIKSGVSPATISKMKKDGVVMYSDTLVKICIALDCTLNDIVELVEK